MNFQEANAKLQGRCYESRKLQNNTYLKRRGKQVQRIGRKLVNVEVIAVQLHATDVLSLFSDGRIRVNTGGWDTVTTRDRISRYLPKPWTVYGERKATILSNFRWYAPRGDWSKAERKGSVEVVLSNSPTILADGSVQGGGDAEEFRREIREQDNGRNRLRSRLRYWIEKARNRRGCKLTVQQIMAEENTQIRSAKIMVFGLERYFLEAGAQTLDESGEYTLLYLNLDDWNHMVCLKMVCPSTGAAYISPVDPRLTTIDMALDWMFDTENYRQQLVAES